jgi:hypothetical protein
MFMTTMKYFRRYSNRNRLFFSEITSNPCGNTFPMVRKPEFAFVFFLLLISLSIFFLFLLVILEGKNFVCFPLSSEVDFLTPQLPIFVRKRKLFFFVFFFISFYCLFSFFWEYSVTSLVTEKDICPSSRIRSSSRNSSRSWFL